MTDSIQRKISNAESSSLSKSQGFTAPNSLLTDDSSLLSSNGGIYAAIFEFSQASFPNTIWEYGSYEVSSHNSFKLYVVNTPVNSCSSDFNTEPSIIISSFEGSSYIAAYIQLFDAEARGFARTIIFTIATSSFEVITKIHSMYYDELINIMKLMQKPSLDNFPKELKSFAKALNHVQKLEDFKNVAINSKMDELKTILKLFNIENYEDADFVERPVEYFTIINNKLRTIQTLIHLDEISDKLKKFIDSLPTTPYLTNIVVESDFIESNLTIDFGGSSNFRGFGGFPVFAQRTLTIDETSSQYSLINFSKNNIFFFIGFTLLSGQTLIIRSNDLALGESFAKRLLFLVPFFRPEHFLVCDSISPEKSLKYSIVVTKSLTGDAKHVASVLDLQLDYYAGDGCPPSSIVWKVLGKSTDVSEKAFILHMLIKLKECAANFVMKLSEMADIKSITPDSLLNDLKAYGFSKDDSPILKYWIAAYFNKDKLKPILRDNKSKSGLTMAPF